MKKELLAPNGKSSKLTAEQYELVRTPAFKKWFGDWENDPENSSKVIDEETKEPLVVYHGGDSDFNVFDLNKTTNKRFHFTTDIEYAKFRGGISKSYFLKINNLTYEDWSDRRTLPKPKGKFVGFGNLLNDIKNLKEVIVFESTQIKLADGTNTTFDGDNPDIRFNNGGSILLAPNGKPSKLTAEQYELVRTPAFKKWFGDWENDPKNASKVIDKETKEPLIVYHGTDYKFNTFDKNKLGISQGTSPANMYGFYFSNNKIVGKSFGKNFKECFIKIKNPKTIDLKGKDYSQSKYIVNDFVEKINVKYDGGILFNYKDSGGNKTIIANQYIVPNSNQIKLADGTNTNFDSSNPDIRFDEGGEVNTGLFGETDKIKNIFLENKFTEDDLQIILEENENYFNQIEFYDNETLIVYRALELPRKLADKFIKLNKKEISDGIGEYWTFDKNLQNAIWGDGHYEEETYLIQCKGHLKIKDIDWEMMKYAYDDDIYHFSQESEIRGVNGGNSIKVVECEEIIYSNGGEVNTGLFSQIWGWFGIKF